MAAKFFVRYGYVPLLLIGMNGLAIFFIVVGLSWWWLIPLSLVCVSLSFLAEYILPYEPSWNDPHKDFDRDLLYTVLTEGSAVNSVFLLPVAVMLTPSLNVWPNHWPLVWQVLAAIVIADFGFMLVHYLSHKLPLLWRFHAPHHSVERLYGLNGLVKHPVQVTLEVIVGTLPLIIMGFSREVAALLGFAMGTQLLLQHSNADYRIGRLSYVLSLAPAHRFHHVKEAKQGNVNFGLFFTFWDHLFGTFKYQPERNFEPGDFGMEDAPNYPRSFYRQLAQPFLRDTDEETPEPDRPQQQPAE